MRTDAAHVTADTHRALAKERQWLASQSDDILRSQIEVAQIAAPTGDEGERAAWMARQLGVAGLKVHTDEERNVVASVPGVPAGPAVVVCAHLDTVFPGDTSLDVRHDGSRVEAPGICDNGRGLAVMLAVARVITQCRRALSRAVQFVATTGEEGKGDLRGARHFFANSPDPFAVVVLDGAGDERIVNTGLGSRRFRVEVRGPGGHSWAAFGVANPIHAAARAASGLANVRLDRGSRSTLTVSRIGGGMSINAIPEDAWFEVDVRSTRAATLASLEQSVREVVSWAVSEENDRRAAGTPALSHSIARIGERPSGQTSADSSLVVAAREATVLSGRRPELATASTDANAAMGIGAPAIAIGGGGAGGDAHTSREWFDNTAASAGVERAFTIIATMARIAGATYPLSARSSE